MNSKKATLLAHFQSTDINGHGESAMLAGDVVTVAYASHGRYAIWDDEGRITDIPVDFMVWLKISA